MHRGEPYSPGIPATKHADGDDETASASSAVEGVCASECRRSDGLSRLEWD
jgi:hypothetical protein